MSRTRWRLLLEGPQPGAVNMAVDRALLAACESGGLPTLRLYGWDRPTLSVGYAQQVERDIDSARCAEEGIPIVRRPTGGRALLHDREVTYALVAPVDHSAFGPGLKGTFASISRLLLAGLTEWGLSPGLLAATNGGRGLRPGGRSPACFAAVNHGEITLDGRKLIGSAQRRTHRAFLQHGSLLLDQDVDRLPRLCRYPDETARRQDADRLRAGTVTLQEALSGPVAFDAVAEALARGIQRELGGAWETAGLDPQERALRDAFLKGS